MGTTMTGKEALKAMLNGKKVRGVTWIPNYYNYIGKCGEVCGGNGAMPWSCTDFIKSTRRFEEFVSPVEGAGQVTSNLAPAFYQKSDGRVMTTRCWFATEKEAREYVDKLHPPGCKFLKMSDMMETITCTPSVKK